MEQKKICKDNPFTDETVAKEWISSVEGEHGMIRDTELYPALENWAKAVAPKVLIDIGSGQGICADHVQFGNTQYVGIDPSETLVRRAYQRYPRKNRHFVIGCAYHLPFLGNYADAAFSVNVWFHLENLEPASKELARALQPGGRFFICSANPNSYDVWQGFYYDAKIDEKKIDGKVNTPVNPLSRNVFYKHTNVEIASAFDMSGLIVDKAESFGYLEERGRTLFISYIGHKS